MAEKDENNIIYFKTLNRLRLGYKIRDDCEELIRIDAPKKEIKKGLFIAEMTQQYAQSIMTMTKNDDEMKWIVLYDQAENLEKNIYRTIIRMNVYLQNYTPEEGSENENSEV